MMYKVEEFFPITCPPYLRSWQVDEEVRTMSVVLLYERNEFKLRPFWTGTWRRKNNETKDQFI